MPNLKCHEYKCSHNHCTHCGATTIGVNQNLACKTYEERDDDEDKSCYEFAGDLAFSFASDEHLVACIALDCTNNNKECCTLNNLRIDCKVNGATCVNYRRDY